MKRSRVRVPVSPPNNYLPNNLIVLVFNNMTKTEVDKYEAPKYLFKTKNRKPVSEPLEVSKILYGILLLMTVAVAGILFYRNYYSLNRINDGLIKAFTANESTVKLSYQLKSQPHFLEITSKADSDLRRAVYQDETREVELISDNEHVIFRVVADYKLNSNKIYHKWVKIDSEDQRNELETLGIPIGGLLARSQNLPILPVGNFNESQIEAIDSSLRSALKDARPVFSGSNEYRATLTESELKDILRASKQTKQSLDESSIEELLAGRSEVNVHILISDNNDGFKILFHDRADKLIYSFSRKTQPIPSLASLQTNLGSYDNLISSLLMESKQQ